MAQTAIATYPQFQAFAPTLSLDQATIDPLLTRAHVWSQAAIADTSTVIASLVQNAECQYVLCLLEQLPTSSTTGSLKLKKVGHAEEEYYEAKTEQSPKQNKVDCDNLAWQFLYLAGVEKKSSFFAGVVR